MSSIDHNECETIDGEEIEEKVTEEAIDGEEVEEKIEAEEVGDAEVEAESVEREAEAPSDTTVSLKEHAEGDGEEPEETAPASGNDTLSDVAPGEQGQDERDEVMDGTAERLASAHVSTEDALCDEVAEPHMVKLITEEPQVQACLPSCLDVGSESAPIGLKAIHMSELDVLVVPEETNEVKESPVKDSSEPPEGEGTTAQDITGESEASKDSIADRKEGAISDGETTASEQGVQTEVLEATARKDSAAAVRCFRVMAIPPQDLFFVAPPGSAPGQSVWVKGPHGPLMVCIPEGTRPGHRVQVRLSAPFQHEVFVPAGAKPGDRVFFLNDKDERLEAVVPQGKKAGDVFHVGPPATMLRVPEGAIPGDQLRFVAPVAPNVLCECVATVPPNMSTGQYFAALLQELPKAQDNIKSEVPK